MAQNLASLRITARAESDLLEIYSFISEHAPHVLEKIGGKISKAFDQITRFPKSGAFVKEFKSKKYREKIVFHYRIIYKYLEEKRIVQIITIRHGKRFLPELID